MHSASAWVAVQTLRPTSVSNTSAKLNAEVTAAGAVCWLSFTMWKGVGMVNLVPQGTVSTPNPSVSVISNSPLAFAAEANGLSPCSTYTVMASGSCPSTTGTNSVTFKTLGCVSSTTINP